MAPLLDPTWNETNGTLHSMNGDTSSGDDRILPQGDDYSDEEAAIGDDEVDGPPTAKQKTSVRKQQDRDDFRAHIRLNETRLLAERKRKKDPQEREEILSLKELMAQQESTRIISNPRDYQMKLFERAKERNTIAVLDTGSGKTLIAVLLLKHIIDQELEDRAGGLPPRISFFLVCSSCSRMVHGAEANVYSGRQGGASLPAACRPQSKLGSAHGSLLRAEWYRLMDERGMGSAFQDQSSHCLYSRCAASLLVSCLHHD